MTTKPRPRRLILRAELKRRVPYSMVHVWRLEQLEEDQDPFPKRITIGPNRVAWDELAVDQWIERRIRAGRKIASPRRPPATSEAEGE
jgi:prophage regulatory protein